MPPMVTAHGTACKCLLFQNCFPARVHCQAMVTSAHQHMVQVPSKSCLFACSMFTVHVLPQMVFWKIGTVTLVIGYIGWKCHLMVLISYLFVFLNLFFSSGRITTFCGWICSQKMQQCVSDIVRLLSVNGLPQGVNWTPGYICCKC